MQNMVGGPGCSVDGTVSGANPLGRVVDQFLGGMGPSGAQGRMQGGRMQGGGLRNGMQQGFNAQQQRAQMAQQRGPQMGGQMNDIWMAQQRGGGGMAPPPPQARMMQQRNNNSDWAAQAQAQNGGMDAAFAAAQSGQRSSMPRSSGGRMSNRGPMMGGPMMGGPMMGGPMMMGGMGMNPMMMGGMGGMGMMGMNGMMNNGMMNRGMQQQRPMNYQQQQPMVQKAPATAHVQPTTLQETGPAITIVDDATKVETTEATSKTDGSDMTETRAMTREMVRVLSQDPKFQNSEFLGFMQQISTGEVEFDGNKLKSGDQQSKEDAAKEAAAEPISNEMKTETMEARLAEAWKDTMAGKEVDLDAIWNEAIANGQDFDSLGPMFGGPLGDQMMAQQAMQADQYQFPEENRFRGQEGMFELGMEKFNQGMIEEAIEAFQSFVESETDDPSEGWRMLGLSHQEHDEDRKAIQCLEKSVDEDPYNLESLLALGVSYVNELNSERALRTLKLWVEHNPSFQNMAMESDPYSDGSLMDEVMQLMVSAQKAALANGGDDGDVNVVLGVLYNVSRDYDSAVEAFQRALVHRSNDYSLWNKLGATLANGSRSEQAIPAYEKALAIKPRYARGRLNLGISHANLQNYEGAARAYLSALRLNPDATHIWSYLRIAFTCMERFDLVQKTEERNLDIFGSDGAPF